MENASLSSEIIDYLNKPSTHAFFTATKSYLAFCEQLIKGSPNSEVLKDFQPLLSELYYRGSKLESVPGDFPKEWQELDPKNDGVYEELINYLGASIDSKLKCQFIIQPLTTKQQSHGFFIDEHLAGIYLQLHDDLYRIEKLATPLEIHAGLHLMKRGFSEFWGMECAILLSALHNPSSDQRKIAMSIAEKYPNLN